MIATTVPSKMQRALAPDSVLISMPLLLVKLLQLNCFWVNSRRLGVDFRAQHVLAGAGREHVQDGVRRGGAPRVGEETRGCGSIRPRSGSRGSLHDCVFVFRNIGTGSISLIL